MDNQADLRKEVEDADDTGMIANEALITQAETLAPLRSGEAALPHDRLHEALPRGHDAHAAIDRLHQEMQSPSPDAQAIERHVGALRAIPELEAIVANWWDDPRTQRFVGTLGQIGL